MINFKNLFTLGIAFLPFLSLAQDVCEPIFTVPKVMHVNSVGADGSQAGTEMIDASDGGSGFTAHLIVGQPFAGNLIGNVFTKDSSSLGFFSYYIREPIPPTLYASDGDYESKILVQWEINDSYTGPPVTSDEIILYRNGFALTTLSANVTEYQDFNVFAGVTYEYEAIVTNARGASHDGPDYGFLNPNGMITGLVETPNGNPVQYTQVIVTPNLGLASKFNGDGYIFWYDRDIDANRQFSGFEDKYTIETWFRSVTLEDMTIFAAVDSASTDHYVDITLDSDGYISWTHSPTGSVSDATTLTSIDPIAGPGEVYHHLALVYDGSNMTMFIDGYLIKSTSGVDPIGDTVEIIMGKKGPWEHENYYQGYLDDFRIWYSARAWEDIRGYDNITLSGEEDSLAAYWKFDESAGDAVFDLAEDSDGNPLDNDGEVCLVDRTDLIADVFVGGLTDSIGMYSVKNVGYGTGTSFTVTPSKETIIGRSVEFDGVDDYIDFASRRIDLSNGFTLESWFKTPGGTSDMILFSSRNPIDDELEVEVYLSANAEKISVNYFEQAISTVEEVNDNLWHHWAITVDTVENQIAVYIDGSLDKGSVSLLEIDEDATRDITVVSEFRFANGLTNEDANLLGYIDEVRLWDNPRTVDQITGTMNQLLDGDETGLASYWNFNDGSGTALNDAGNGLATGELTGMETGNESWSIDIPLEEAYSHYYSPESRYTTLNFSNTSVDLVDFTDISLLPVTGYVMYEGTNCFIEDAEILINDESQAPFIKSDANGKYTVEIEPGLSGDLLSVDYEGHEFDPAYIELPRMTQPLSGQYFYDKTLRTLSGIVAGGTCEFPLPINEDEQIVVTVSAIDNCIEIEVVADDQGNFTIDSLPPIIYNISAYHPNPDITFAADTVSLETKDREKDFIYFAPLEVVFRDNSVQLMRGDDGLSGVNLSDYPDFADADAIIQQPFEYTIDYFVFEAYDGDSCQIDTFDIVFTDDISGQVVEDSVAVAAGTELEYYKTQAYTPNLLAGSSHSYQQSLKVNIEDSKGRTADDIFYAVVLGDLAIDGNRFVLSGSNEPWYVLRVPPGDESYSYLGTENEICSSVSKSLVDASGAELEMSIHLGPKTVTEVGIGVTVVTEVDIEHSITPSISIMETKESNTEQTSCLTFSETYTAYGDGEIMGNDATVFIGGSNTYTFGLARSLSLDAEENSISIDTVITENGKDIASTYMHSRFYIENVLMVDLLTVIASSEDQEEIDAATEEYEFFENLMANDLAAVASATESSDMNFGGDNNEGGEVVSTITWDAGVEYEYTTSSSRTAVNEFVTTLEVDQSLSVSTGTTINGIGVSGTATRNNSYGNTTAESEEETTTTETGFVLSDDDPGDGFSVTVKMDPVWNMPVFVTNGGQSSCPWEEGTARRQVAQITSNESIITDVPPEEPAVFTVNLGNASEVNEDETYYLTVDNSSNPYGLTITASGNDLAGGVQYELTAGEFMEVLVSVDRGPELYEYEDIVLQLVPDCEFDDDNWINYDEVTISVTYKEPCSESIVSFPEDGWLVDASHSESDGDTLIVTVSDYDLENSLFEDLSLQYRKDGIGDWYTAETFDIDYLTDSLISNYIIFNWNINPSIVTDGEYELRSVITCSGDGYDGVSQINSGLIDRTGPQQLTTTPADGILGVDDLISITFNETIDCDAISLGAGDITFMDTETGNNIDFTITCGDDIVIVNPAVADRFLENTTLRVDIKSMLDVYGNDMSDSLDWEFYFNRNPVAWDGSDISNIIMYVDEEYSTTRTLVNSGGANNSYYVFGGRDISSEAAIYPDNQNDLPVWLEVSPTSGTLTPDSEHEVTIGLIEGLDFGEYETTIYAGVSGVGDEELNIYMRKLCYEPEDWVINASDFEYSMNMTAVLYTQPSTAAVDTSDDIYDMVGVFVGDELRGVASVEYLPSLESLSNFHPYEVFLTIYSNTTATEELSFKVWDASDCTMLGTIIESYNFEINEVLGSLTNPVPLTATSQIVTEIGYPEGWTWLSFNTIDEDMSVNTILGDMDASEGDIIKSQDGFSIYDPTVGWFPSSFEISHQHTYKLKLENLDTLTRVGFAVDVELDTIDIGVGWNWIGYTPQESYEVNEALESLSDVYTGDLIKSQTGFAQFLENYGWFGSLAYMSPKEGYLISSSVEGELLYPFSIARSAEVVEEENIVASATPIVSENVPEWIVSPSEFSSTMSVVSSLVSFDSTSRNPGDIVGAFIDGVCRGTASPQYVEPLDEYLVFLTIHGDEDETRDVVFQVYHEETDEILYVPNNVGFVTNDIIGSITEPYTIDARTLNAGDPGYIPVVFSLAQNYPNPFNPVTKIGYGVAENTMVSITVYNLMGEKVATLVNKNQDPGYYFTNWDSRNDMGINVSAGMYIYQIRAGDYVKSRKLILLK